MSVGPERGGINSGCQPHCPPSVANKSLPAITVYGHSVPTFDRACTRIVWESFMQRKALPAPDPKCAAAIQKALKYAQEHDEASPASSPSAPAAGD